jgi:hypothetical protein
VLAVILKITNSDYGFIGTVMLDDVGVRDLKNYAATNVISDEAARKFYQEKGVDRLEVSNLNTLFGYTITTSEVVISNDPTHDNCN